MATRRYYRQLCADIFFKLCCVDSRWFRQDSAGLEELTLMLKTANVSTVVLGVSHASSVYTHSFTPLMLCQLGCFLSMPYYANAIWVTCMYPTCCRLTGSSFCSEVVDAVERRLSPPLRPVVTPNLLLCKLSPYFLWKWNCVMVFRPGGCRVSGMLACYDEKIMWAAENKINETRT